jgi:hypothetical protein
LNFTSRGTAAGTKEGRRGSDASLASSMVKDSRREQRSREGKGSR